jgi:hypothetical protein
MSLGPLAAMSAVSEQDLIVRGETGDQSVRNREASIASRSYGPRYGHHDSVGLLPHDDRDASLAFYRVTLFEAVGQDPLIRFNPI